MTPKHSSRRLRSLPCCAVALFALASGCHSTPKVDTPQDFEAKLRPLVAAHEWAAAESLIDRRERALPGDAEVYVSRGNLYFQKAFGAMANTTTGLPGAPAADSTGNSRREPDTLLVRRAMESVRDGIARHPERLDMRFGLAYLLQQLGDPESEFAVLSNAVAYAKQHPDSLRWTYGEPLPSPPDEYVPQVMHDYVRFYLERDLPGDELPMLAIARLSAEAYPRNNRSTNDVAFYYGTRGEWQRSLEFLHRAEQADSSDALVLYNLGWAHENLGHRSLAVRYYTRAVAAGEAGRMTDVAQSARARLDQLRSAPVAHAPMPATAAPKDSS